MKAPEYIRFSAAAPIEKPDWVIPGLKVGQVGLMTAPGGTGKSYLLLQIAMSVASGQTMIPGLDVSGAAKACLLNYEDDAFDIRERGNAVLRCFGVESLLGDNIFVASMSGTTLNLVNSSGEIVDDSVNWLKEQCSGKKLLILDPLSHVHSADENSAASMSTLIQVLKGIAQECGTAILIAHHTAKAATLNGQGHLQQSARGSSALVDASRLVMALQKCKGDDPFLLELVWSKINGIAPISPLLLRRGTGGVLMPVCRSPFEADEDSTIFGGERGMYQ